MDVFDNFIKDYFRARPWMLEADGSFKISSLDMDPDNPAEWGGVAMTSDDQELENNPAPSSSQDYMGNARYWIIAAEERRIDGLDCKEPILLSIANALISLGIQFQKQQEDA